MKQTAGDTSISDSTYNPVFSIIFSPMSFTNHYEDAKKEPLPAFPSNASINRDVESPHHTPNKTNDDTRRATKNNNK